MTYNFNMNIRILTQIGLESYIFITVGDLFACGKTKPLNSARSGGTYGCLIAAFQADAVVWISSTVSCVRSSLAYGYENVAFQANWANKRILINFKYNGKEMIDNCN